MPKMITDEQKRFIDDNILYLGLKELADELGVKKEHVRNMIYKVYGDVKMWEIREKKRNEICETIKDNECTLKEIRSLINVSHAWVTHYIRKHDIKYIRKKITRAEANELKQIFYKPVDDELNLDTETFEKWFRRWFHTYRDGTIQQVTRQHYYNVWLYVERSDLSHKPLKDINRGDVQRYVNTFGMTRSKLTVLDHMQLIRSAFNDAILDGHIRVNPAANIKMAYKEQKLTIMEQKKLKDEKKWLEVDEYQKFKKFLVSEISDHLNRPPTPYTLERMHPKTPYYQTHLVIIFIALKTGARIAEVLGITRDDVIKEHPQRINIDKTWNHKKIGDDLFLPTKNISSIREVNVDEETIDILTAYMDWADKHGLEMTESSLFNIKNRRIYSSEINATLRRILKLLDIEPISMHKLRHTMASYLIAKGVDLMVVAKRLGHTDTGMVMKVYGHLLKETEDEHNEKIMQLL